MKTKLTISGCGHVRKNKYYRKYVEIIRKRITIPPRENAYTENHHILPKSLGGSNCKSNLILLTGKEHYIVHWLLTKFLTGNSKYKMICAFMRMNLKSKYTAGRYADAVLYEKARQQFAKELSIRMKVMWKNDEYKERVVKSHKIRWAKDKERLSEFVREYSPFKTPEIHKKTIATRTRRGTNIFETKNPMLDKESKKKKLEKTSGANHWLRKRRKFFYSINNIDWIEIDCSNGLEDALRKLNFSVGVVMRMLREGYVPKRGNHAGIFFRREIL